MSGKPLSRQLATICKSALNHGYGEGDRACKAASFPRDFMDINMPGVVAIYL